jgi:hypothetical protein
MGIVYMFFVILHFYLGFIGFYTPALSTGNPGNFLPFFIKKNYDEKQ